MKHSVVLKETLNILLKQHLIRKDGQEDLCFALYKKGTGQVRVSGIITDIILPEKSDRNLHGNVSFNSSFFDKVTQRSLKEGKGIVFIHSHPSKGWQSMSPDDVSTEEMLAPRVRAVTNEPLIGMTIGTDGAWSARFWEKEKPRQYKCEWCESVRIVGRHFSITINNNILPVPKFEEEFIRTISAWGHTKQAILSRIKVGIVGIGSVGSQLAECLLRTGVQNITLIDFDLIERKNLDRLHGIRKENIGYLKSEVYSKILEGFKLYPSQKITSIPYSIVEETGFNSVIDCDIVFCCVDRPWPRFILNCIAYAYHIPVIDGGIDCGYSPRKDNLDQARWRTYTASPERRCIKCMDQYKPEDVSLEQSGLLEDQIYIKGLPEDHFSKRGENVYAFSLALAGLQIQQFLSLVLTPKGVYYGAKEMDFITGNIDWDFKFKCDDDCEFSSIEGMGDDIKSSLIQSHKIAEKSREKALKIKSPESLLRRILKWIKIQLISKTKVKQLLATKFLITDYKLK